MENVVEVETLTTEEKEFIRRYRNADDAVKEEIKRIVFSESDSEK